jgi:type I restriction enzyme S subunit
MSELPRGWKFVPLAHVCDVNPRDSGPGDHSTAVSFVPMPAVSDTEGIILPHDTKPFTSVAKGYTRFREQDVIFAKITPCMENGKIAIAAGLHGGFACGSTEFHVLRSSQAILPSYLWRFVRQESFRRDAERHMTGAVGQRRVPAQYIKDAIIPLAPVLEQRRIVAKVDKLFECSKSASAELARVPGLVERYKLAVLAAAFRGDATANWRTAHPTVRSNSLIEKATGVHRKREGGSTSTESSKVVSLPQTWRAAPVESIGEVILGRQRSPENHSGPNMRPYVRAANITWDGWDLSDVKKMNFDKRDFERFKLQRGDVLINEGSGSADEVGKPAIWNGEVKNCCFQNTLIAVRPHATIPEYLYFVLLHAALSKAFVDEARGVNIHHIGRAGLAQFVIPVPPSEEQQEIVRRIKAAFRAIDKIMAETSRAAQLLDRLDQAALAKAFRGELQV